MDRQALLKTPNGMMYQVIGFAKNVQVQLGQNIMLIKNFLLCCVFVVLCACSESGLDSKCDISDMEGVTSVLISSTINATFSSNIASSSSEGIDVFDDMILVKGSQDEVLLGTNLSTARSNEKPLMKVIIDYDYQMDRHETTCRDFIRIVKEYNIEGFSPSINCTTDSLPVSNVTYFDAILYANSKSKLNNVDTAYDYNQITIDEDGHCTNLSSFSFHPERKGFRLPTEAEWIKAASQKWDSTNGWNNSNSNYEKHAICSKENDSTKFCDFAGNVMEWANDWLGQFKDTSLTNYVGAPDGGELNERVVKGGAFNTNAESINRYSRGDVYTVTSSTKADYVGFRLVYGAIPNPLWLGNNGMAAASIITPLASSYDLYPYTKSYNIKLAFRNDETGNLAFIDYTTGMLSVTEITDTLKVYHPEISPNGEHVAFCTKPEGIEGTSILYVRNLDAEGSELTRLNVESAAIPRWKVLAEGDTIITFVTNAGNNKDNASWKNYSTWQVPFNNGKFGTPQKITDGSFHGGISEDKRLAVTGARLLRARIASNLLNDGYDSLWYNGEQACNVSLAQDNSKRTAFLDFAGKTGKSFVGADYGVHEILLIADSLGNLIQYIPAPNNFSFDHTEWAVGNNNNNIIATLTNANGAHKKISLVNLSEGIITDLAEGEELWHPCLWIKGQAQNSSTQAQSSSSDNANNSATQDESSSSSSFNDDNLEQTSSESISSSENVESSGSNEDLFELDLDSAGMYYNTSGVYPNADRWRYKMEFLWQYRDTANVIALGSSRMENAFAPLAIKEPVFAVNLAVSGNSIMGSSLFLEKYIYHHMKKLKVIVLDLDIDRWWDCNNPLLNNPYKNYMGYVYDQNHNFWRDSLPEGLTAATFNSPGISSTASKLRPTRGRSPSACYGWGDAVFAHDSIWTKDDSITYYKKFDMFKDIVQMCTEKEIYVIGVIFPQNPKYKETGAFGRYGLRQSTTHALIDEFSNIANNYPYFILMDENKFGNHDYTDDMARDADHLGDLGAEKFTQRIDSLIHTLDIEWE